MASHSAAALAKRTFNLLGLIAVAPAGVMCRLESRITSRDGVFLFWAHVVAGLPGLPGVFLRRAFYRWALDHCAADVTIGFGTLVSRRGARFEQGVYIGPYALIGWAWIRERSLIGSRTSLLSGGNQHRWLPEGGWSATEASSLVRIEIGPDTWIGEGAIVLADVGAGSMIIAGAVVSAPVPAGVRVGGNPARFVSKVVTSPESAGV